MARTSLLLVNPVVLGILLFVPLSKLHADDHKPSDREALGSTVPVTLKWNEVSSGERIQVLKFLKAQTSSNYQLLATWSGLFNVKTSHYWTQISAEKSLGSALPDNTVYPVRQEFEHNIKFAIDLKANSLFTDPLFTRMNFYSANSKTAFQVKNMKASDARNILTPVNYIKYSPTDFYPGSPFSNTPQPRMKTRRAAHRLPTEKAEGHHLGDVFDPRNFFCLVFPSTFWESLQIEEQAMAGTLGDEAKRLGNDRAKLYKAVDGEVTWYRHSGDYGKDADKLLHSNVVYCSSAGYNPVSLTHFIGSKPDKLKLWTWIKSNGVFIPQNVVETFYDGATGSVLYTRASNLDSPTINGPIAPNQFDYAAVRMEEGDWLFDEIDNKVYQMKNGVPSDGKDVQHSHGSSGVWSARDRLRMVLGTIIFIAALLLYIWYRRSGESK